VTDRIPVTQREWALFGLRWITPAALLFHILHVGPLAGQNSTLVLGVGVLAVISNLVFLLLLMSERWSRLLIILGIVADVFLALGSVAIAGGRFAWLGLVPIITASFYFNWAFALGVSLFVGIGIVILQQLIPVPNAVDPLSTILAALMLSGVGVAFSLMRTGPEQQLAIDRSGKRAERLTRLASQFIDVMYEMVHILSVSQLDPTRVVHSALEFVIDGLERTGVPPPIYGAVLLFSETEDGQTILLRVTRTSSNIPPSDEKVIAWGVSGAIGQALTTSELVMSEDPANDEELRNFENSFAKCAVVLCVPLKAGADWYGVLLIGSQEAEVFKELHTKLTEAIANQASASLHNAQLNADLREQRDRIVRVEKDARAQLAGDLHDGPTQSISAIAMRLNYTRKLIERKPEEVIQQLFEIEDMARRTTKEIRAMLFELRPKALDDGLEAGLKQLAIRMKETYDQNVEVQVHEHADKLLDEQATLNLFSTVVEATHNARKHAHAELIMIELGIRDDNMVLEITDNGAGFDAEKALAEAKSREGHLGLINLQERARFIEGSFFIKSAVGKGTKITVAIPMEVIHRRRNEEIDMKQRERGDLTGAIVRP
jgi:signal transduction histidine kinase